MAKKKSKYSKFIVGFVIAANIIFTAVVLGIFHRTSSEPTALITAWFGFTTVEVWQLARIKTKKIESEG
jgi:Na+(H+)/acetate symporter ActP